MIPVTDSATASFINGGIGVFLVYIFVLHFALHLVIYILAYFSTSLACHVVIVCSHSGRVLANKSPGRWFKPWPGHTKFYSLSLLSTKDKRVGTGVNGLRVIRDRIGTRSLALDSSLWKRSLWVCSSNSRTTHLSTYHWAYMVWPWAITFWIQNYLKQIPSFKLILKRSYSLLSYHTGSRFL